MPRSLWVAEEVLAIALYCCLLAVNHVGDSDSTGSIAGNVLGTAQGAAAIPRRWSEEVELREEIVQLATDLFEVTSSALDPKEAEVHFDRYPSW